MKDIIPKLKTDKFSLNSIFINCSSEDFSFDCLKKQYPFSILDVFEEQLKDTDTRLELLDNEFFKLKNELKYINFISTLFIDSNSKCYLIDLCKEPKDLDYLKETAKKYELFLR